MMEQFNIKLYLYIISNDKVFSTKYSEICIIETHFKF